LADEEMIIGFSLGTRRQIIRTGRILGPQEGLGDGAGGGPQRNKQEIKKNPSVEGHKEILIAPEKSATYFYSTFETRGCQMGK
jgi:hypothetical protein